MRRERIERKASKKPNRHLDVLPLDPRDTDVVRAKELVTTQLPPRRRAA
ncbi:MAG TPA: hypothetical protein VF028_09360 [Actinomycetota bacterium]|jgi:hypothetical protein|nr:hypothetical protein [Actinomycetota bacterium]